MDYEWDEAKNLLNRGKHGLDFAEAIAALEDPNRLEDIDPEIGEERIRVIGMARDGVLFVITTFLDDNACRIISARKATRDEEDRYYAGDREEW